MIIYTSNNEMLICVRALPFWGPHSLTPPSSNNRKPVPRNQMVCIFGCCFLRKNRLTPTLCCNKQNGWPVACSSGNSSSSTHYDLFLPPDLPIELIFTPFA